MKNILTHLGGPYDLSFYLSWTIIALFGYVINKQLQYSTRRSDTEKWSWNYFIKRNWKEFGWWIFFCYVTARFNDELKWILNNYEVIDKMFIAFGFGFLNSSIIKLLKKSKLAPLFSIK